MVVRNDEGGTKWVWKPTTRNARAGNVHRQIPLGFYGSGESVPLATETWTSVRVGAVDGTTDSPGVKASKQPKGTVIFPGMRRNGFSDLDRGRPRRGIVHRNVRRLKRSMVFFGRPRSRGSAGELTNGTFGEPHKGGRWDEPRGGEPSTWMMDRWRRPNDQLRRPTCRWSGSGQEDGMAIRTPGSFLRGTGPSPRQLVTPLDSASRHVPGSKFSELGALKGRETQGRTFTNRSTSVGRSADEPVAWSRSLREVARPREDINPDHSLVRAVRHGNTPWPISKGRRWSGEAKRAATVSGTNL
jgi:hypothetical protein